MPDSPAFYEERIRLLQAEIQQLRDALDEIAFANAPGMTDYETWARPFARVALEETLNPHD